MKYNFVKLLQGGGVTNTSNSSFDRSEVNKSYLDIYRQLFANNNFNLENFNNQLSKYYSLISGSGYSGDKAKKYEGTADYQMWFNDPIGIGVGFHTTPFMQGWSHTNNPLTDSGDNFDSGKWNKADDYVGAITKERRANFFNPEELVAQNALAKEFGMEWEEDPNAVSLPAENGGRKYYRLKKISDSLDPNQKTISGNQENKPAGQTKAPKGNNEDVTDLQNIPLNPPDKLPWTDYVPITVQATNNWLSAVRQANLQKQMRFPLQEAPFLQHKITNNYHLRTGMQQNANELRDLAAFRSNSSDLRQNLDNMYKYDTQASQIKNQAEQEKANKFAQETQISENVAHINEQTGVKVTNQDAQINAAAQNNILNANQQLAAQKAAVANDWIDKMTTSHGQNVLDNRLNQQAYQRGLIDHAANIAQQNAYDEYLNASDYKNSQAYKSLLAEITAAGQQAGGSGKEIPGLNWTDYSDESKREAELERFWNSDSELASHYRTLFSKELEQAEKNLMNKYQLIGNRKAAYSLQFPYRLNNQGFYIPGSFTTPTFRRGGSVRARFIDYQNHTQIDQHNALKSSQRRSEQRQKALDKQLDRLSKEQLLLLRSIFK